MSSDSPAPPVVFTLKAQLTTHPRDHVWVPCPNCGQFAGGKHV